MPAAVFVGVVTAACVTFGAFAPPALAVQAPAPPELTAPVNDFAGVIDDENEAKLDDLVRKLLAASGDTMVVATVRTFKPEGDIRAYANKMFENHGRGIGQKGKDNGVLILLAVEDREIRIEVGYDLESIITDGFAGETSRQMVPYFRNVDYGGGLLAGASRLASRIAAARGVTLEGVPVSQPVRSRDQGGFPVILILFFAIMIINAIRGSMNALRGGRRRRRRGWSSWVGPFGAGYGSGGWSRGSGGGFGGGFGGFGGGRSGGGGGGASW